MTPDIRVHELNLDYLSLVPPGGSLHDLPWKLGESIDGGCYYELPWIPSLSAPSHDPDCWTFTPWDGLQLEVLPNMDGQPGTIRVTVGAGGKLPLFLILPVSHTPLRAIAAAVSFALNRHVSAEDVFGSYCGMPFAKALSIAHSQQGSQAYRREQSLRVIGDELDRALRLDAVEPGSWDEIDLLEQRDGLLSLIRRL